MVRVGRDVALLQEAGSPRDDLAHLFRYEDNVFRDRHLCDRWSLVVQLSDRVEVERLRQVPPGIGGFGASGIGTMAAARVTPRCRPWEAFVALHAQWIGAHPCTMSLTKASDMSAHRILVGPLSSHRLRRPSPAPHSRRGRPKHVLRCDRPRTVAARAREDRMGPVRNARPGAPRAAGAQRPASSHNRMFPTIHKTSRHTTSPNSVRRPKPTANSTTFSRHAASTKGSRSVPSTGPTNGAQAIIVGF